MAYRPVTLENFNNFKTILVSPTHIPRSRKRPSELQLPRLVPKKWEDGAAAFGFPQHIRTQASSGWKVLHRGLLTRDLRWRLQNSTGKACFVLNPCQSSFRSLWLLLTGTQSPTSLFHGRTIPL